MNFWLTYTKKVLSAYLGECAKLYKKNIMKNRPISLHFGSAKKSPKCLSFILDRLDWAKKNLPRYTVPLRKLIYTILQRNKYRDEK
jgi:hypothetical protein